MWLHNLLLLIITVCHHWGASSLQQLDPASSLCTIQPAFESPLISAYLEENVAGRGCVTNVTTPGTGRQVHAISYHSNGKRDVQLYLTDLNDNDFLDPAIIVLSSTERVQWQVRIKRNPRNLRQLTFLVSKGSGLRFANKRIDHKPRIRKLGDIPNDGDELVSWLQEKYGVVTSFASFDRGTSVHLNVGFESQASADHQRQCSIQGGGKTTLSAHAVVELDRDLNGCVVTDRRKGFSKHAYVVELKRVTGSRPFEVDLEIRRQSRQTVDKEFWLVLKSPSNVTWRVHTRKVQGYINIVANSFVDMAGIRMHTVAVRSEQLKDSGMQLLQWVEYFLGPVAMYAQVNDTNRIKITLPETADRKLPPSGNPNPDLPVVDPMSTQKTKLVLKRAMRMECSEGSVIVAVSKIVLQMLGIKKDMMSLLDPQCRAVDNQTHVYIHSAGSSCGTNFIDNGHGKMAFINTLVIHAYSISEEIVDRLAEGSGEGDVYSGSGQGPELDTPDVYLDDEDVKAVPLQISFMCEVDNTGLQPPQTDASFQLGLYHSILFETPIARFPLEVPGFHTRLYLQAMVTSNPVLRAEIRSCWLSHVQEKHDEDKYYIVNHGCAADSSVSWYRNMPTKFGGVPQSQRLSFTLEYYLQGRGNLDSQGPHGRDVYLKCYLSTCCIEDNCGDNNYPACVTVPDACEHRRHQPPSHVNSPKHLVIIGPVVLPSTPDDNTIYNLPEPDSSPEVKVDVEVDSSSRSSTDTAAKPDQSQIVIQGLDSGTVVGIAFAAFIIGVLMMGALWFIHTHSGSFFVSGPFKRSLGNRGSTENEHDYGETTPGSSAPIST